MFRNAKIILATLAVLFASDLPAFAICEAEASGIVKILSDLCNKSNYPAGATPVTASVTGTTGATAATLPGAALKTTYICGFSIRANATAAVTGNATVTGTVTGTMNFTQWTAPLASGIGILEPVIGDNCIPANGQNTSIVVTSAAPGAGGTVSVTAWGFRL